MSSVVCAPKICMYCRNASISSAKPITHECAIVPLTGMPNRRPASRFDVETQPATKAARAAYSAASSPCARRLPNSMHRAPLGRAHDTRGLAGHRRLKRDEAEQRRLDQLRLGGRRGHAEDRLVAEDDLAFVDGPHVAGEAEGRQVRSRKTTTARRPARPSVRSHAISSAVKCSVVRYSSACSRPAATRYCRWSGRPRTNSSKVRGWSWPDA